MRWPQTISFRFRSFFRRRAAESELDDELRFHLERTIEQNLARGMTREEARRLALVDIGGVEQVKEECREARGWHFLADTWRDVCYGARMLRKSPGFAIVAILTLALGIGANVSMLGVVDALFFRLPAHIRAPSQLIQVGLATKAQGNLESTISYGPYEGLSKHARVAQLGADLQWDTSFGRGVEARKVSIDYVSPSYFRVLGTPMLLGRAFDAAEDRPSGSPPVVVLGYDLWQRAFDGSPKVLGRTVWIGGQPRTVVGVAPRGFTGTGFLKVDAWLPIHAFREFPIHNMFVAIVGRLHGGATTAQARAEVTSLLRHSGFPLSTNRVVRVEPLFASRWSRLSSNARISLWIAGVALIVLLIACVNVSGLMLARMAQRRHEMAVRQQLGATRGRLARQVLVECLMLSAAGGAAALLVVLMLEPLVRVFLLPTGFYEGRFLSWRMLAIAVALAMLAGCGSALAPAWRASGPRLAETLRSTERGHTREGAGLRWALVVTQVALALLLVVGAGLFLRSLRKADALNLGFEPNHLLHATVDFLEFQNKASGAAATSAAYARLRLRAEQVPGVNRVALANMETEAVAQTVTARSDAGKVLLHFTAWPRAITPNYFATMGIRILEGRPLLNSDTEGSPPVVVVNQSLARDLWPGQNPLGKCMRTSIKTKCARVVGVVPDVWPAVSVSGPMGGVKGQFYVPLRQALQQGTILPTPDGLLIRTGGKSASAAGKLFAALESVLPPGRFVSIEPFSKILDPKTRSWRLGASMFSLFGALALILAAVGIYGVLAFLVRQRTAEIGMRMALGATPGNVLRMVIGEGMKVAAIGISVGACAAFGLTRLMKSLLYGVSATDPLTFAAAGVILVLVTLLACSLAAWRAMRVDPNVALRHE